jgi:hypothetical protein
MIIILVILQPTYLLTLLCGCHLALGFILIKRQKKDKLIFTTKIEGTTLFLVD